MELRRDLLIAIGVLVAFNVLISFGSIGLLTRMSPAIERILDENVYSIEAAESMMAVLATSAGRPATEDEAARFADALRRAHANITERAEEPAIAAIIRTKDTVLAGEITERAELVAAVQTLVQVNRDAMRAVDKRAQRMGTAGAWLAVFIALIGFIIAMVIIRRVDNRIMAPLEQLYRTLEAARAGEHYRRCNAGDVPADLKRIFRSVNRLLDERLEGDEHAERVAHRQDLDRALLLYFLEARPDATFLLDRRGHLLAANGKGLGALAELDGEHLRGALAAVPAGALAETASLEHIDLEITEITAGQAWLCAVRPASSRSVGS